MQDYENAYEMARSYSQQYPDNQEYRFMLNDIAIDYIKYLNDKEDYGTVKSVSDELLAANPKNMLAYNYGIGARISMSQYDEAMQQIQQALVYEPDSKELRLKEAGVYSQSGQHDKAVAALQQLTKSYPYNSSLKSSLIEEMLLYAKQKEEADDAFGAKDIYSEVLLLKPNDTTAAIKLANIHVARQEYAEAMAVVDKSLTYNKDNQDLLYLKGVIYEEMGDFKNAKDYQSKYHPPAYKIKEHEEHLDYLDSRMLKNQINLSYLHVNSDSLYVNTSVATLEYMRLYKKNTYIARVNYAARSTGVGVQGEVDWYHTFNNKSNFLANAGFSGNYFPKYKLGFSFFQPFKKSWQAELGGRYSQLQGDITLITGILGVEKTMDHVWLNARVFVMSDGDEIYNSILAQGRFYMRNERDYALAMASVGNAPEDQRLDFQINSFLSYVNTMVGAGYFHYTSNRTSIGLVGNWYSYKISSDFYLNQYNLYLTLRTKF
jgi:YaiO family outer membrane protein